MGESRVKFAAILVRIHAKGAGGRPSAGQGANQREVQAFGAEEIAGDGADFGRR